jgi:predicted acyl esterase
MWWGDIAPDQRPTDAYSLVYDSGPLAADMEILGLPQARLKVAADAPQANWFVRLSDVAPDGTVTQVTGAGFNGTHRNSARQPEAIVPGELFPLDIEMHFTSWVFPKGHRIRFAVSNAQWPMLWPTPYAMTTTLKLGGRDGSHVVLPVVPAGKERAPSYLPVVERPVLDGYESLNVATSSGYGEIESVERNPQNGDATATATNDSATRYPWGTELFRERIQHRTSDQRPEDTEVRASHELEIQLADRVLLLQGETKISSDKQNFYFEYSRRLSENGTLLRQKSWSETIPRDYQ